MRTTQNIWLVMTLLVMTACSSCTGLTARQEALLPSMRLAWQNVGPDVARGIDESVSAGRLDATTAEVQRQDHSKLASALEAGNPAAIAAVPWTPLSESAHFGLDKRIEKNELSTGTAESLRTRLTNFGESLTVFLERR